MRKFSRLFVMLFLALVLTACGGDDADDEPTTTPVEPAATTASTEASDLASPSDVSATPATTGTPETFATPVASPVTVATPSRRVVPVTVASPAVDATPESGVAAPAVAGDAAGMQTLSGTVSLPGTINERFVIADNGCVGLGRYAGVQAGQQVVVRDGTGGIVGVTELEATGSAVVCTWTFEVEVAESDFYAVSIPMLSERVFSADEVDASNGQIELLLP